MITTLEPRPLWKHFADLNAVPRPSKKEARVIQFIQDFARGLDLEVSTDSTGNVLVNKPASPGREHHPVVALQSHLDMVHQKNADTDFDFDSQGIRMVVEGDWVRAEGTTLGADNGIGVAAMMAILADKAAIHPPLEALFTIDEETGMTGAKGLQGGLLQAKYMLNLDTEDDHELTIGCAGGVDVLASGGYEVESALSLDFYKVVLNGLSGGHSGMDIHRGRGNANKILNRFLHAGASRAGLRLVSIDGGGLRNAIPREASAVVGVPPAKQDTFIALLADQEALYQSEYRVTDPNLRLSAETAPPSATVVAADFQARLLRAIYSVANGIYRMSPDVDGLVQTSNNLARVLVNERQYAVQCLTRGSLDSEKMDLATAIGCSLELLGAEVHFVGEYPGWTPRPESSIVVLMSQLYEEIFSTKPLVNACHAGLECGILGKNYPDVEMVSFGPNIRGAHSPDERVQISSVQKFWVFLRRILERL